jgi:tetratricopeptide (TPR) repeat protein
MPSLGSRIEQLFAEADRLARHHGTHEAQDCYRRIIALAGIERRQPLALECAHWALAQLLVQERDPTQAEGHLREAIRLNPREAGYRVELGSLLNYQARYEDAIGELESALDLEPGSPEALHRLGWAVFMSGDQARGREILEQAAAADGFDTGILNDLAVALLETGQAGRARRLAERACAIDPKSELLRSLLAMIRQRADEKAPG